MPNLKNPKNPNPRGQVNVALGSKLYKDVAAVAEKENRAINRQVAVIVREWLEMKKNQSSFTATPLS